MDQAGSVIPMDAIQAPAARLDEQLCVLSQNALMAALIGEDAVGRSLLDGLSRAGAPSGLNVFRFDDAGQPNWRRLDLHPQGAETFAILTDVTAERSALENLRYAAGKRDALMKQAEVEIGRAHV